MMQQLRKSGEGRVLRDGLIALIILMVLYTGVSCLKSQDSITPEIKVTNQGSGTATITGIQQDKEGTKMYVELSQLENIPMSLRCQLRKEGKALEEKWIEISPQIREYLKKGRFLRFHLAFNHTGPADELVIID